MEHVLFSLIVPMYNVEKYLPKCLWSIKEQTFQNFEVLLVDDGSTDGTVACCKENIENDERFKIIENKTNMGVSASRNRGLRQASGEWIWFIDADDWIDTKALAQLAKVVTTEVDMIAFDFVKERRGIMKTFRNSVGLEMLDGEGFCERIFDRNFHFQSIWSEIFRRDFLQKKGIWFDERLTLKEDSEFIVRVGSKLRYCLIVDSPLYHYSVNMQSMSQKWNPGVGKMNMRAVAVIDRDLQLLNNPLVSDGFYQYIQSVVRTVILKDIFHPDCPFSRKKRKARMRALLDNRLVRDALKKKHTGKWMSRLILENTVHRRYFLLRLISWGYYRIQGEWFWKLYSRVYGI